MLLEAGFVDVGLTRLEDALAMAPNQGAARWDVSERERLKANQTECDRQASGPPIATNTRSIG